MLTKGLIGTKLSYHSVELEIIAVDIEHHLATLMETSTIIDGMPIVSSNGHLFKFDELELENLLLHELLKSAVIEVGKQQRYCSCGHGENFHTEIGFPGERSWLHCIAIITTDIEAKQPFCKCDQFIEGENVNE